MVSLSDLYDILQEIRKRPGMWGVNNKSLHDIESIIHGYKTALLVHGIREFGTGFNHRFDDFLMNRFGGGLSIGWARYITEHSQDADEAFDRFFGLVDEFHQAASP